MYKENSLPTTLSWEATYEIARALMNEHPEQDLEKVSLGDIYKWTIALPAFSDEPQLANDEILAAIFQEWFEEINPL